ncbi:inorganic diphosphatase [Methanolobus bombayensis]|uniref:inorganic diphosphatase n=1 Tax=Methanolobus bombayensis TaxID=38023 RepID=UPI001AE8F0C4|nr:inorganic diphosphatase [Methanolobus bombayensis]MBP1909815.1 inorganic pyrophosphatase [Methanolobus bombayensis]
MKVVIETPKYSFFKYNKQGSCFVKEFLSPIPTIFNYGFIKGSLADDGMEKDVVVIGPRVPQGTVLDIDEFHGVVKFVDDSLEDNKQILCMGGFYSKPIFYFYFHLYATFKILYYLILKRKISNCRFNGIEWHRQNNTSSF